MTKMLYQKPEDCEVVVPLNHEKQLGDFGPDMLSQPNPQVFCGKNRVLCMPPVKMGYKSNNQINKSGLPNA